MNEAIEEKRRSLLDEVMADLSFPRPIAGSGDDHRHPVLMKQLFGHSPEAAPFLPLRQTG